MPRHMPVSARSGRRGKVARVEGGTSRRSPGEHERPATEDLATNNTLSAADAAFLYLERKEMPLAIACVLIFDGPIPFNEFVASVASKSHRVPRFHQVVVMPPLNIGLPTWEDDPHFDIRHHISRVTLDPPGGEAELETLVGGIFSQMLDRSKPLWEIHVVYGLKGGRGALIWRLHHALADGVSGLRMLELFLDSTPKGSTAIRRPVPPLPQPSNSAPAGSISGIVHSALDRLIATESGLLGFAQAVLGDPNQEGSRGLFSFLPELLASVEKLPFNKPCGEGRKFCWAEFDMAEIRSIREALGGRVNDVILTVLTRALARYVQMHGQSVMKRFVRIVCPVSLRKPGQEEGSGNQISFMPVALPMDVQDPAEMLRAIAARTETMKSSGAAGLVGLAAAFIAKAPPPLQALFWWGLPELILPVPLFNMICTNVPGSPTPLYALGRRMIAAYPQVPTGYDLGINCAVESYDGKLFFGLVADAQVASDVNRLRDFLYVSFQELRAAARKKAPVAANQPRPRRKEVIRGGRSARKQRPKPAEASSQVIAEPVAVSPRATAPLKEIKNAA
jgi:diacylglycerol O-acyltransferase / wax synthase